MHPSVNLFQQSGLNLNYQRINFGFGRESWFVKAQVDADQGFLALAQNAVKNLICFGFRPLQLEYKWVLDAISVGATVLCCVSVAALALWSQDTVGLVTS